jgi:hypothetical protein
MKKMITIDYDEYNGFNIFIQKLQKQIQEQNIFIQQLKTEISFLKDKGDGILIIEKDAEKNNIIEYKSTEKSALLLMVDENKSIRINCEELNESLLNCVKKNNQLVNSIDVQIKQNVVLQNEINKLKNDINELKFRGVWHRLINKIPNKKQ